MRTADKVFLLVAAIVIAAAVAFIVIIEQNDCSDGNCPYRTLSSGNQLWSLLDDPQRASVDVPHDVREPNYAGGSCVHASMITVLRMQGQYEVAEWWRQVYAGGESLGGLIDKAADVGLLFAYTGSGDTEFLEWCDRTNRCAVIFYYDNHSITFTGFRVVDMPLGSEPEYSEYAVLIDNNNPQFEIAIPKSEFLSEWRRYGGVALTAVYSPLAPTPQRVKEGEPL